MSINESIKLVASKRSWEETRDKSLVHLVKNIKKLESSTLYTQNYIADLEEASNQLLACFTFIALFAFVFANKLQINSLIKALTSLASYIQNQFRIRRDYIMSISSITSSTSYQEQIFYSKLQSIIAAMTSTSNISH